MEKRSSPRLMVGNYHLEFQPVRLGESALIQNAVGRLVSGDMVASSPWIQIALDPFSTGSEGEVVLEC